MEKSKKDQLAEASMMYRGEILNDIVVLEKTLDYYIVNYIATDVNKQIEVYELLMDRISFHEKKNILEAILRKNNSETDYKKKYSKLIEELGKSIRQRNIFAHYMVNVFNNAIDRFPNEIEFINFRDSTSVESYDAEKYKRLRERIKRCIAQLEALL